MPLEYPYQLTTFIAAEPQIGEAVYDGTNGWYPQIALKRRFKLDSITEQDFIRKLHDFCATYDVFVIHTGTLTNLDRIPVKVITVEKSPELLDFHLGFIATMTGAIQSRYPDRDGVQYLPHITAEYDGKMVINPGNFTHKAIRIEKVWLLKDIQDENSQAYHVFNLRK